MKVEIKVTELTHEELAAIIEKGILEIDYFRVDYDHKFYDSIPDCEKEGEDEKDRIADVLLHGGFLRVVDWMGDGHIHAADGVPAKTEPLAWWDADTNELTSDAQIAVYTLKLEPILRACSSENGFVALQDVVWYHEYWDSANNIIQKALFGTIRY